MGKTLVIAEKPSVGRDLTKALPGAFQKHEGYLESETHVVTWAVGHLVQLAEPDEYDAKYKKWRMADLPIVPDRFKLVVRDERSRKQMTVITRMLKRDDVSEVVNACDAGREGELIFAWTFEKAGAKKPVRRLWLSSMTGAAIKSAFSSLRPASEFEPPQPVQFAQAIGFGFAIIGATGYLAGVPVLGMVATAAALVAAFLNAAFGLCLGCEVYLLLKRATTRTTA